ncbi:MAG: GNAT family N-acetyltransferase [Methanoregula sp.]|nr:MAG: GNAT family N-acetyltransferase [Methanoregula sp.]
MAPTIEVRLVEVWDAGQIVELYRAGGWWKEGYDPNGIPTLISGSFLFAVAVVPATGSAVGMGRVLSDGVSDGYIQDVIVLPAYRRLGIGKRIVSLLLRECRVRGLGWIGLVAEPGSEQFYLPLGFRQMKGYIPLLYDTET